MRSPDDDERTTLLRSLALHSQRIERSTLPEAARVLLETDLTLQQLKVLTVLIAAPDGIAMRGLAEACGVSMASMSTMVDRLVAQNAARREVDPHDQRVRRLHATALGRQIVQRLAGARPEFAQDILARLSLADLRALEQGLRAVVAAIAEDADAPGARRAHQVTGSASSP